MTILTSNTRSDFRNKAKDNGPGSPLRDIAAWCAYDLLYLVEYADINSQEKIGPWIVHDTAAAHKTGETDAMVYHTGRANSGDNAAVQYRWIENPWGNVREFIDGINFNNMSAYICTNPANYADDTTNNYTAAGVTRCSSDLIKGMGLSNTFPWAFLPDANGGSEITYIPDYMYSSSGRNVLNVGGYWTGASGAGLFSFNANFDSSVSSNATGARLQFREVKA